MLFPHEWACAPVVVSFGFGIDSLLLQILLYRALHSIQFALDLLWSLLVAAESKLLFSASKMPQFAARSSSGKDRAKVILLSFSPSADESKSSLSSASLLLLFLCSVVRVVNIHAPCVTQSVSHESACICLCNRSNHLRSKKQFSCDDFFCLFLTKTSLY